LQWSAIERDARTTLRVLRYRPSKTAHLEDPVTVTFPITPALEQVLDGWRQQLGRPKSGHVFPAKNKENAPMEKKSYQRHWAIVKKLAELDRQDIHFYSFRHNFISDMVRQGVQTLRIAN